MPRIGVPLNATCSRCSSDRDGRSRRLPMPGIGRATCCRTWRERTDWRSAVSKSFVNDILLALWCREAGCMLVTDNERDFQRIRRYVRFDYVKPWPGGLAP